MDTALRLPVISLQFVYHRNSQWILITGDNAIRFNTDIRHISGRKYSKTYRSWLLPSNRQSYNELTVALQNKATIDTTALKTGVQTKN